MKSSLIQLTKFLKPFTPNILLVLILLFCSALADLYLPTLMADIVDQGVVKANIPYILKTGGLMLAVALGGVSCALVGAFHSSRVALGFSKQLRLELFTRVENYSLNEFDRIGTSSLITRTTSDVMQVQHAVIMMMGVLVRAPIMGIGGMVMALMHDRTLSWVFFIAVPTLAGALIFIASKGVPLFQAMQKKMDTLNLVIREKLTGIRVVRAFDRVAYEKARFDHANQDLTNTGLTLARLMTLIMPLMMLIMNFTVIAIVWFGSLRIASGHMQVGDMMAFIQYALQILFALMMVSMLFIMIPRAEVSAGRIDEVLNLKSDLEYASGIKETHPDEQGIVFDNVSFKYHGAEEPALCDISFTARYGAITAIIGSTGAGKTTLINLLPRFYEVTSGSIRINGEDIRRMDQQHLRALMGLVPQRAGLFTGTISDNLSFGRPHATKEECIHAAETSQAMEFIKTFEGGFEGFLAQGGKNLSGGQKQRLSIARALIRKPKIYIFDDSFSALDFKTDAALRKALKQETAESAVLMVAQRVTTIMDADQIIVLDEGCVAGIGRHTELMASCEVYREIVYSQLSQEELA